MKKYFVLLLLVASAFVFAACKPDDDGIIWVGNAATTSGVYGTVGVPFNNAIRAAFEEYNRNGGFNGREVQLKTYDDTGDSAVGTTLTERLVEEDKVFALVGHFGTWTVGATIDYIREIGVPMVYAATGVNALYFENTPGNPVMAVQPIYKTDGRVMTARAVMEPLYGSTGSSVLPNGAKIGVLYTNDDVGNSIKDGVETQIAAFAADGKTFTVLYETVSTDTYATAAVKMSNENVDVIILAMNQGPFAASISALHNAAVSAPIFTSYVNADTTHIKQEEDQVGDIYVNGWYGNVAAEQAEYERIVDAATFLTAEEKANLKINTHAKAGFIAASVFLEGLRRVGEANLELTRSNYIEQMEIDRIKLPLAGYVDFRNGQRIGTDTMSLSKYDRERNALVSVRGLQSIPQITG